jgi:multisubunit Na+/H+ antiporter MnhB subunit
MRPAAQMLLLQTTTPEFRYSGGGVPKGAVIITALALLYLLPSMLAFSGGKRRRWKILAINGLLGWTIIGWIASMLMVWAYEAPADSEPAARP